MKPTPLKNKRVGWVDDTGYSAYKKEGDLFTSEDISSAVEWLKQEILTIRTEKELITVRRIFKILDKAFEDVTKEEGKWEKQ